jgi:hypothetical protein
MTPWSISIHSDQDKRMLDKVPFRTRTVLTDIYLLRSHNRVLLVQYYKILKSTSSCPLLCL